MARWLIHLSDGRTLTDSDCFPHEIEVMKKLGYSPDDITSIERIIRGKHLTIKKSDFIDTFFVATEEGIDFKMGSRHQEPPTVTKRILGCYLRNTEPPIQVKLIMDPRTFDTRLELMRVKRKTLKGINADPVDPPGKNDLVEEWTKEYDYGNRYSVRKTSDMERFFNTRLGFAVHLKEPKIRLELVVRSQNVLLGVMPQGERLKVEFPSEYGHPEPEIQG